MTDNLQKPDFAKNMRLVGHSDVGGRSDGVQIMVNKGHAIIAHMFSQGFSVVDVRDPSAPETVAYVPSPPNTWSIHLQAHDDFLLVINGKDLYRDEVLMDEEKYYVGSMSEKLGTVSNDSYQAGMRVFDIKNPAEPKEIGFLSIDGVGVHRIWYVGGRWAYMSAMPDGFSDFIFMIVDMEDPTNPKIAGQYWIPGMNTAAGETPTWEDKYRYSCHHGLVDGDTAYVTWRDGGLTILDISDKTKPELVAHRNWCPPYGGGTHNALPLPDKDLLVVVDEAVLLECADGMKYIWVFDIREPSNPVSISTFPQPSEIDYIAKGGHFGPHNVHENRPGSFQSSELIFATYNNAGLRAFDISNPYAPVEVGAYVPAKPDKKMDHRPDIPPILHAMDVYVDENRLIYFTDMNGGLHIVEMIE